MAKAKVIPTDLTLDITGDISPDEFVSAVRNFFGYIKEITDAQQSGDTSISWTVKVKEGSSLVGLEPSAGAPSSHLAMIYNQASYGVTALSEGNVHGAGLNEKAIDHLKSLSEIGKKSPVRPQLKMWVRKEPVLIGEQIAKAVKESADHDYDDYGTIEGRLEEIKDSRGILTVGIRDILYPKVIRCEVPDELMERVLSSFRRRVELTGKIRFRHDGVPLSIETSAIDVFPEDEELPSSRDVRGILASA